VTQSCIYRAETSGESGWRAEDCQTRLVSSTRVMLATLALGPLDRPPGPASVSCLATNQKRD